MRQATDRSPLNGGDRAVDNSGSDSRQMSIRTSDPGTNTEANGLSPTDGSHGREEADGEASEGQRLLAADDGDTEDTAPALSSPPRGVQAHGNVVGARAVDALLRPLYRTSQWAWSCGALCCVASAVVMSGNAVLIKFLSGVPIFEIAMARSCMASGTTFAVMRFQGRISFYNNASSLPFLLFRGLTGSTAMILFYGGIQTTSLGDAVTIMYMFPAVTAVLAFLVLGERLRLLQVAGVIAAVAGVVLIARPPFLFGNKAGWDSSHALATGLLVGAAFCAATSVTLIRKMSTTEESMVMALWFHMTAVLVCTPFIAAGWPEYPTSNLGPSQWAAMCAVGLSSFAGNIFANRGIQLLTGAKAACIVSLQVPMSHLWGTLFFHEETTLISGIGTVLTIGGIFAVNGGGAPKKSAATPQEETETAVSKKRITLHRLPTESEGNSAFVPSAGQSSQAGEGEARGHLELVSIDSAEEEITLIEESPR